MSCLEHMKGILGILPLATFDDLIPTLWKIKKVHMGLAPSGRNLSFGAVKPTSGY